jgi:hypothetical protein
MKPGAAKKTVFDVQDLVDLLVDAARGRVEAPLELVVVAERFQLVLANASPELVEFVDRHRFVSCLVRERSSLKVDFNFTSVS